MSGILPTSPVSHYDMAVVWFGSNDAVAPSRPQHVPADEYSANLTEIVSKLVQIGVLPNNVLLLAPPSVDEDMCASTFADSDLTNAALRRYANSALSVAGTLGCASSDLFSVFSERSDKGDTMFCDGLHLSNAGNQLVADVVGGFVSERLQKETPLPVWRDLVK